MSPTWFHVREAHCTLCGRWVVTTLTAIVQKWRCTSWLKEGHWEGICPRCMKGAVK